MSRLGDRLRPIRRRVEWHVKELTGSWPEPAPDRQIFEALAEMLRRREQEKAAPVSLDLTPYELRVFSQNGEDGVLAEILRRIGTNTGTFVEFGTESGIEANCVYLADVACWRGHFLEGDAAAFDGLRAKYALNSRVTTTLSYVSPSNVEALFAELEVPAKFDVLSIDVDGQDYWIWKGITAYNPSIVVIEYNGALDDEPVVVPEGAPPWSGTDYFGASLRALRNLAADKGYRFVYSDLCGTNAFFVRSDLASEHFLTEDDVQVRSTNYRLTGYRHPAGAGTYTRV